MVRIGLIGVRRRGAVVAEISHQVPVSIELIRVGEGDCEDLAGYRAAELRMVGEPARVKIVPTSRGSYHAIVERGDGSLEDPSRLALMLEAGRKGDHQ